MNPTQVLLPDIAVFSTINVIVPTDKVMVHRNPNRKHGSDKKRGPYTVTRVNDNGTLRLKEDTNIGEAVHQTWNMNPCKD